jgi:hypothetical protein
MVQARCGYRRLLGVTLLVAGMLAVVGPRPAAADVAAVTGSAYGYRAFNISLFGGAQPEQGPAPRVNLAADASNSPQAATAPSASVQYGPAVLFESGAIEVRSEGRTGAGGSVTSSASATGLGPGPFTAASTRSTCTASESAVTGSVTIADGRLVTRTNAGTGAPETTVTVPGSPPPNDTYTGTLDHVGDSFRIVFNEQVANPDGSLTVNAAHMYLLGPTARGDLVIGQSVCGVTAAGAPATTTTAPGAATTTTTPAAATTTTAPDATTTTALSGGSAEGIAAPGARTVTAVSGGAYGYYASVGLFGGPPATRGPAPSVTLPATGADPPLTAAAPNGGAVYGPAELFVSGAVSVRTQGVTGPAGSASSSASVADVGPGPLTVASLSSSCRASLEGETASTTLTGGVLTISQGADVDAPADDRVVQLPADPAPNTTYEGRIENVGDTFRVVLNEQTRTPGAITVNAVHLYLLGPAAVGELVIGQSRCATVAGAFASAAGTGVAGVRLVATGAGVGRTLAVGVVLAGLGVVLVAWSRRPTAAPHRADRD